METSIRFEQTDVVDGVFEVFRQVHGEMPFTFAFVVDIERSGYACVNGACDFSRSPPAISIREGLGKSDLIEALCHELAHLASGHKAGHDEVWARCRDELSLRYGARHVL